jgi:hypothetical protein
MAGRRRSAERERRDLFDRCAGSGRSAIQAGALAAAHGRRSLSAVCPGRRGVDPLGPVHRDPSGGSGTRRRCRVDGGLRSRRDGPRAVTPAGRSRFAVGRRFQDIGRPGRNSRIGGRRSPPAAGRSPVGARRAEAAAAAAEPAPAPPSVGRAPIALVRRPDRPSRACAPRPTAGAIRASDRRRGRASLAAVGSPPGRGAG